MISALKIEICNLRSQILLSATGDCIKDDVYLSSIISRYLMKTTCNSPCSQLGSFRTGKVRSMGSRRNSGGGAAIEYLLH
jgi:hypothetical protein